MSESSHFEVAIIGAGPGGIAAAHLLLKRGITDLVILEREDDFGGTWRDNHYPAWPSTSRSFGMSCPLRAIVAGVACSRRGLRFTGI